MVLQSHRDGAMTPLCDEAHAADGDQAQKGDVGYLHPSREPGRFLVIGYWWLANTPARGPASIATVPARVRLPISDVAPFNADVGERS